MGESAAAGNGKPHVGTGGKGGKEQRLPLGLFSGENWGLALVKRHRCPVHTHSEEQLRKAQFLQAHRLRERSKSFLSRFVLMQRK